MKSLRFVTLLPCLLLTTQWIAVGQSRVSASQPASPSYVITNDDAPLHVPTSGSFFPIGSNGLLQNPNRLSLGGQGSGGGYFAGGRVSVLQNSSQSCAYLSLGGSSEISAINVLTQQVIGNFSGGTNDSGVDNGIALVNNGTYLYAGFSTSNTLATFNILSGCSLNFLGDISPLGLNAGNLKSMAIHGNMLVIAYGDGSIESYNASAGIPVSNGDLQNATGFKTSRFPAGVDITQDGHYAIFGDQSTYATVEVSDISSGKLTTTVLYNVGNAGNSVNVMLSPDETLLYVTNTGTGQVGADFFNATTGKVTLGCISKPLHGFDTNWVFSAAMANELNTGTGSVLYVAEFGSMSGIAEVKVTSSGGKCTLTEAASSPFIDPSSVTLLSIGVYPPRSF